MEENNNKPTLDTETNSDKIKKRKITIIGVIIGGTLGYAYFHFVGCNSGACSLRANPYYNILLGSLLGWVASDWIFDFNKKRKKAE